MKKCITLICALICSLSLTACTQPNTTHVPVPAESDSTEVLEADPYEAIEKIYADVDISDIQDADSNILKDKFYIDTEDLEEFCVRYSSGNYGVADVFILKPVPEKSPQVREMLEQVKLQRMKEFENYDIYNSYEIAKNAVIFEQGEYLVMLMLADNDAARDVINRYIPKR